MRMASALVYWRWAAAKKSGFLEIPDFHSFFSQFLAAGAQICYISPKTFKGRMEKQGWSVDRKQRFFRPYENVKPRKTLNKVLKYHSYEYPDISLWR